MESTPPTSSIAATETTSPLTNTHTLRASFAFGPTFPGTLVIVWTEAREAKGGTKSTTKCTGVGARLVGTTTPAASGREHVTNSAPVANTGVERFRCQTADAGLRPSRAKVAGLDKATDSFMEFTSCTKKSEAMSPETGVENSTKTTAVLLLTPAPTTGTKKDVQGGANSTTVFELLHWLSISADACVTPGT
jgi:hypothetical protein